MNIDNASAPLKSSMRDVAIVDHVQWYSSNGIRCLDRDVTVRRCDDGWTADEEHTTHGVGCWPSGHITNFLNCRKMQ